ncbi:MAG: Gfo/Idh/MocA family oxidoreductase [Pirellulales bacterium]|nr:Gfo/Idh/MocA family oxidoreductase [Pirellulales bacterium]
MINVGLSGIGFMGLIHFHAYRRVDGVRVAALSSQSEQKRSGDWRGVQGNFGPAGEQMDISGIATYPSLEAMLTDDSLNVVDVCLPAAFHAEASIAALKAGKHVFCEKPISVSLFDARRMMEAAEECGKQLAIGHVLPFFAEFGYVLESARNGRYGKPLGGHFKRIISDPTWLPDFYDPVKTGGPLLDLHIHDAHFIRLLFGQPSGVFSTGRLHQGRSGGQPPVSDEPVVEFATTQFLFDGESSVTATSGVITQQGRSFTHAFEVHFEQATLLFDFAVIDGEAQALMPLTVLHADGRVERPALGAKGGQSTDEVSPFAAEIDEFAQAIETGVPSPILDGQFALDALILCHAQTKSIVTGDRVTMDQMAS